MSIGLSVFFSFLISSSQAQNYITGIVKDSITSEPVSFATIGIAGTNKGTITNEKGEFILKTDALPNKILISSIGYKNITVIANREKLTILLSPSNTFLKPIVIKAGEAEQLFLKVYTKLQSENNSFIKSKAFFRLTTKTDNQYTEMIESFYTAYLNNTGIKSWEFEQGRYALLKSEKQNIIASLDFSTFNRQLDLLNKEKINSNIPDFPFRKKALSKYYFSIEERYLDGEDEIIKLKFEHRNNSSGFFYNGVIHINARTLRISRVEAYTKNMLIPPISLSSHQGKIDSFEIKLDIKYRVIHNLSVPLYVQYDFKYLYTPSFAPKGKTITTRSKLVFFYYENKEYGIKEIPGDSYNSDYDLIEQNLYLPWFWENNKILAETPIEKQVRISFEENKSFGKTYNTKNDTLQLNAEGYYIRQQDRTITLNDIILSEPANTRNESFVLVAQNPKTQQIDTVGGIYSDLFFAYNCHNDTFYYILLPLIDLQATFFTTHSRESNYIEQILVLYTDLLECYCRELKKYISETQNRCQHKNLIRLKYIETLDAFHVEKFQLIEEVWEDKELAKWQDKISKRLSGLEAYK